MDKNSDVTVNTNKGPSNKWLSCFLKRHPEISMRTPDSIDRGRYGMANTTVMNDCWKNVLIIWVIPVFIRFQTVYLTRVKTEQMNILI